MRGFQFSETFALKIVSLLLALTLWVTILDFKQEEFTKNVKLEPLLPPGVVITNKIPTEIRFTLSGPRRLLKDVESRITPIRPDLRKTKDTTIGFAISEDLIGDLPNRVRVVSYYPPNILIRLEEVIERVLPVKVLLKDNQHVVTRVMPSKVKLQGPKSIVQSLEYITTEELNTSQLTQDKILSANIDIDPLQGFFLPQDKEVRVWVSPKNKVKK